MFKKIDMGGRKVSYSKVSAVIESIVDNIILAGFDSADDLYRKIVTNTGYNIEFESKVINKIMTIYTDNLRLEMSKLIIGQSNIDTVNNINDKCIIIMTTYDLILSSINYPTAKQPEDDDLDIIDLSEDESDSNLMIDEAVLKRMKK